MECEFPTTNSNNKEIIKILKESKNIAVVGLSPNPQKPSHRVAKYMQEHGYKIFPIYPKEEIILNEKVYRSLDEIEERIDIVNFFRKPAIAMPVLEKILTRDDVKTFWLQVGIVNNEAAELAKKHNLQVVQNKCIMVEHRESL